MLGGSHYLLTFDIRTSRAWVKSVSIGLVVSVLHRGLDP
jgi:hypothetical protein